MVDIATSGVIAKDSQIITLETQLSNVINVTGQMIEKHEAYMVQMVEITKGTNAKILELEGQVKTYSQKVDSLENIIREKDQQLEEATKQICQLEVNMSTRLKQVEEGVREFGNSLQNGLSPPAAQVSPPSQPAGETQSTQSPLMEASPKEGQSSGPARRDATTSPQKLMPAKETPVETPKVAKERAPLHSTSTPKPIKPPNQRKNSEWGKLQEVVMVVADANGKLLDPALLHDSKKVVIEKRESWDAALNQIPRTSNPEIVTDIVFVTGMKDVMKQDQQLPDILNTADLTGKAYQRAFPNATIHLGSIAPVNERCINYNSHLQELARKRETPFISTEGLFYERSGMVKEGALSGG